MGKIRLKLGVRQWIYNDRSLSVFILHLSTLVLDMDAGPSVNNYMG